MCGCALEDMCCTEGSIEASAVVCTLEQHVHYVHVHVYIYILTHNVHTILCYKIHTVLSTVIIKYIQKIISDQ